MRRRDFISLLSVTAAYTFPAIAQSKAIPRIAIVGSLNQGAIDALKDSLREFGLVETIIVVGSPASAASPEAVSKTVSNLISQKIDLIFASGAVAGRTAKDATSTIPIVCLTGDLVGAGLVQSLASPGGNVTGISILTAEASARRSGCFRVLIQASRSREKPSKMPAKKHIDSPAYPSLSRGIRYADPVPVVLSTVVVRESNRDAEALSCVSATLSPHALAPLFNCKRALNGVKPLKAASRRRPTPNA